MLRVEINIAHQTLSLIEKDCCVKQYSISSAKNGVGEVRGSYQTPRGKHIVRAKIGKDAEPNTVFVKRRPTGERYTPALRDQFPDRDWILTRILWLSGLEVGKNRLGERDTMRRYIYIHGSPDEVEMGKPGSHGCIRMRNADLMELYDLIPVGTLVTVIE